MSEKIKIKTIQTNAWNRRGDEGIEELASSIATSGLLQPIVVRRVGTAFELVAGERRWRACKQLGAKEIEATVLEVDDATARAMTLVENMHRKRLTPFEEMEDVAALADLGKDVDEIAAMIGKSESLVRRRLLLRVLDFAALRERFEDFDSVPLRVWEMLAAAPEERRGDVGRWDLDSVGAMRRFLSAYNLRPDSAVWRNKDVFEGLPACADCPKRSGRSMSLFPEEFPPERDLCLDEDCWRRKGAAWALRLERENREKGVPTVLVSTFWADPDARQAGAKKADDYEAVRKGTPGAVMAVHLDGERGGTAQWMKRVTGPEKEERPVDPMDGKWRWIGRQVAEEVSGMDEEALRQVAADRCVGGLTALVALVEGVMRFGVFSQGPYFELPGYTEGIFEALVGGLAHGVNHTLRGIARECGEEWGRAMVLEALRLLFPRASAEEILKGLEEQWAARLDARRSKK